MAYPYHPFPIVISLGSNIGARRETFEQACAELERLGVRVVRRSRLYWTRPWGVKEQPPFLNAAVAVATHLMPEEVLARCLHVEARLGRRRMLRWGPRRLDLDLLLYGAVRRQTPRLTLPHPGIAQRDFVLAPLMDLMIPPPQGLAPQGWARLINAIPEAERTILHAELWPA